MDFKTPHVIFSVENPMYEGKVAAPTHEQAIEWLRHQGEEVHDAAGFYGQPERSIIITNPKNLHGIQQLAQDIGQESLIYSKDNRHELRYLNGKKRGKILKGSGTQIFAEPPPDMFTTVRDELGDRIHFRHNFESENHEYAHPHGYDWHDSHTLHHDDLPLKKDDSQSHAHNQAHGPTPQPQGNDQAGGNASGKFHEVMGQFGTIDPSKTTNLKFYNNLENHSDHIENHIKNAGYQYYLAGGKHGKPDLANKNYNTKHLMIYDPSEGSGGDFGNQQFTKAWRLAHEMAHADTLPAINKIYGEGRRLGKLGVRTPREMKRAVHWEDMAVKRQREIMKGLGYNISDEDFNKERNTVLGDAVHRAVTGLFTDPHEMGFYPHKHHIPLDQALGIIDSHARSLGLSHDDETLASKRKSLGKSEELFKAPLPHTGYDLEAQKEQGLPDIHNNDDYIHQKTVKLPNGLEYRKYRHRRSLPESQRMVHTLYNPNNNYEPLAYMETSHEEDATAKGGYHPHAVNWSEVQPSERGKGLGRQLYLAALIHGTGKLTSDEYVSPEAHKMWESFKSYPGLGGKIAFYPQKNELLFAPGRADEARERHRLFVRDKTKLDYNKMFPPLTSDKLAAHESSYDEIIEKAVDDSSWKRISNAHNKTITSAQSIVDAPGHIAYFKNNHPDYTKKVLNHKNTVPAEKYRGMGVSAKMIHNVEGKADGQDIKYMAKPYHAPIESWAKSWGKHPIKGWASLTTRKLFEAADMDDICEDLSAHIHKGVPIVVSKFHPTAEGTYEFPTLNMKDHAKIGIMDFLTNNQDRHRGNMMHVDGTPIAIDHERNFQYFKPKPGFDPLVSPQHAFQGFNEDGRRIQSNFDTIQDDIVDWWNKNKHNIKNEMDRNLEYIKDHGVKNHIAKNFKARWEWLEDRMQHDPYQVFNDQGFGVDIHPYTQPRSRKVKNDKANSA